MKVAVMGYGTVGSGVVEVIADNQELIAKRTGETVEVKYILDIRDFPGDRFEDKIVHDVNLIMDDSEVGVVCEVMGGVGVAYQFTKMALERGKSVCTSNKELVAKHGPELLQIAAANHCSYLFEASVGGGIPIIRPLNNALTAERIEMITGILNGTTNYILTRMIRAGLSFEQALKEAQDNGYAERDPSADIEGHDACRKICILAALSFGEHVYPEQVPTQGITAITLADVDYANSCGYKIKLLGRALRMEDGKVCAYVAPHLVGGSDPLAGVEDVFNAIKITGNAVGDTMFYGRGAGKLPTASAVVGDIADIAKDVKTRKCNEWGAGSKELVQAPDGLSFRWYVRANGTADAARKACGELTLLARGGAPANEIAFLTEAMTQAQMEQKLAGLDVLSLIRVLA